MRDFKIKNNTKLNEINKSESSTYLELFDIQESKHDGMENATFSLLDSIPEGVRTIADVGAGPGIVNRYIPSKYKVLAIDMDEEILKRNHCDTCLGDILDLPLEDKSVDMAFSCDVLEHIEPDSLDKAISEMKRVSRKYIYLQTPNEEILRYSIAWCPNCGNKWHVNFHKNSFSESDFWKIQDSEWRIVRINYTGDVDDQCDNPEIYEKIEKDNLDIYRVDGFTCPRCGCPSQTKNIEQLYELERADNPHWRNRQIKPKYSEIGVLFCRIQHHTTLISKIGVLFRRIQHHITLINNNHNIGIEKKQDNIIDFANKQRFCNNYTGKESIPFVVLEKEKARLNADGLLLQENGYVTFSFPKIKKGSNIELKLIKTVKSIVEIYGVGDNGEILIGKVDGLECVSRREIINEDFFLIRIYTDNAIVIKSVSVEDDTSRMFYDYYCNDKKRGLFITKNNGIVYSYLITDGGVAFGHKL